MSPPRRAAECNPGRKPGVRVPKKDTSPGGAKDHDGLWSFLPPASRAGGPLTPFTPGLRPGLHSAAIFDGSLISILPRP